MLTPQPNPRLTAIQDATRTNISSKVSLTVHPDSLLPFGEPLVAAGGIAESIYENGRKGMKRLHEASVAERDAHDALLVVRQYRSNQGNQLSRQEIPPERRPQLHAALTQSFDGTARAYDTHLNAVREGVDELSKRINGTLADPNKNEVRAQHVASEIREALRQFTPEQRIPFITGAIQDGDISVVRAILDCPPLLCGLMPADQKLFRSMAEERFAPAEYKAREAGRKVYDAMLKAGQLYHDAHLKLVPTLKDSKEEAALAKLKEVAHA